jgi:hypothetical protein
LRVLRRLTYIVAENRKVLQEKFLRAKKAGSGSSLPASAGKNSLPGEMVPPGRRLQRNRAVIQTPPGSAGRGTWVLPAFCRSGEARRLICAHLRMDHPAADPAKALPTISLGLVCVARGKIHKAGFDFAGAKR